MLSNTYPIDDQLGAGNNGPVGAIFPTGDGRFVHATNLVSGGNGSTFYWEPVGAPFRGIGAEGAPKFSPSLFLEDSGFIPDIDRGPAPNGYDRPSGGVSGAASGVSFMNDGSAAPSSRRGAGNGGAFFGNDFGDVTLPGRGNVSDASSGASSGGLGSVASGVGNLLASANVSAGLIPGGVGLSVNRGNQSQNTNIPGFGQGGHNANWGGGSASLACGRFPSSRRWRKAGAVRMRGCGAMRRRASEWRPVLKQMA